MKILLDTNILLSAALFPNGIAAKAYVKAVSQPNSSIVCEYSICELREVFDRKFPDKTPALEKFISHASKTFKIIPTPEESVYDEIKIRDIKDRPLLRAAQIAKVDILLTGDKDFLQSGVEYPIILSPSQFINF